MSSPQRQIRNLRDLTKAWHFIDGGHGYSAPQLFALLIDSNGRVLPEVIQMYDDEFAAGPDDELVQAFVDQLGAVLDELAPGGSVAIMKARPGSPSMSDADRRWIRALHDQLGRAPFAARPLFFATDDSLGVVPPDELIAHAS